MLYLLPLAGLLQMCAGGGVYSLPQSTVVSEAHGPLARLALSSSRSPQALQYYTATPTPHAPVVVPQVSALRYYSVPTYLPQPSYVQNLVDTPTATARLQVRRPAIQKQFYDIEQRTIIRPVGSAVVELEEPLSKTFVPHRTDVKHPKQLVYPNYPYGPYVPFQVPAQSYPPSFIQQPHYVGQRPVLAPRPPPQQFPVYPQPPPQTQPQPPAVSPVETQPPQQPPFQPFPSRPDDSSNNSEFDSSDTVVIDNPDFIRSASNLREFSQKELESRSLLSETRANTIQETPKKEQNVQKNENQSDQENQARNQQILNEFQRRQLIRMFSRQPVFNPLQPFQQILPIQPNNQFRSFNFDNTKSLHGSQELPSLEPIDYESKSTSTESTSTTEIVEEQTTEGTTEDYRPETTSSTENSSVNVSSLDSQESAQSIQRLYSSEQIPSVRNLTPQEAQYNQQKLIELLTGQGEISEIDLSRSGVKLSVVGDSGLVKGRVLSVTSAPLTGQLGDERVSTRRVVVSRPIQTLEEVDVHQPFTKVQRLAVHEPALIKSTHHVTRLPTSVPFLAPSPATLVYH